MKLSKSKLRKVILEELSEMEETGELDEGLWGAGVDAVKAGGRAAGKIPKDMAAAYRKRRASDAADKKAKKANGLKKNSNRDEKAEEIYAKQRGNVRVTPDMKKQVRQGASAINRDKKAEEIYAKQNGREMVDTDAVNRSVADTKKKPTRKTNPEPSKPATGTISRKEWSVFRKQLLTKVKKVNLAPDAILNSVMQFLKNKKIIAAVSPRLNEHMTRAIIRTMRKHKLL